MMLCQLIISSPRLIEKLCVPVGDFAESALNGLGRYGVVIVYMDGGTDIVVPIKSHSMSVTVDIDLAWIDSTRKVREDDTMRNINWIVVHLVEQPIKKLFVDVFVVVSHYHDLVARRLVHW